MPFSQQLMLISQLHWKNSKILLFFSAHLGSHGEPPVEYGNNQTKGMVLFVPTKVKGLVLKCSTEVRGHRKSYYLKSNSKWENLSFVVLKSALFERNFQKIRFARRYNCIIIWPQEICSTNFFTWVMILWVRFFEFLLKKTGFSQKNLVFLLIIWVFKTRFFSSLTQFRGQKLWFFYSTITFFQT
jgi:hypothetical protein